MENQNKNIEEKVMSQIKSGRVKLRSKYIFLAEKLGLGSALALSVLLAVLFFNLALYYLKASDNLGYLSFGSRGLFAFLESFPYLLVISLVIFIFIAGLILKKSDLSYRKPFGYLVIGLIIFILAAGSILAYTSINERIERETFGRHKAGMFFRPFLGRGLDARRGGTAGRITEVKDNYIKMQTPRDTQKVDLSNLEEPPQEQLTAGLFVEAIGERRGDVFEARSLRVINTEDMQMIRRGVHRRFGPMPPRF